MIFLAAGLAFAVFAFVVAAFQFNIPLINLDAHYRRQPIDEATRRAAEAAERAGKRAEATARCKLPPVPDGSLLVLLGVGDGSALSNVSLVYEGPTHARQRTDGWLRQSAEQPYRQTHAAQLEIEAGEQPLYVIASSQSALIWRFSGATERVVQFAAISQEGDYVPRVGAVGLSTDRVLIMRDVFCLQNFYDPNSEDGKDAVEGAKLLAGGRAPDLVVGAKRIAKAVLPSGSVSVDEPYPNAAPLPKSVDAIALIKDEQSAYMPVVEFALADVVAAVPILRFDVLPGAAGLAQLIDSGTLEISGYGRTMWITTSTAASRLFPRQERAP
jgi:hypothetical protein